MVLKLDIGSTNGKIVLHRQTAHADTVAGLPLPGFRRTAETVCMVDSTADFLNSAHFHPLSG